jgi:hypothetical protein
MEDDVELSFDALDHLAYSPVAISPLTSASSSSSPALSPQRRPRSTRAAASASDSARYRARSSADPQKANRPSRDGLGIRSKFFVEVPAPSFDLDKRKRKRGEEKITKKRHRDGRSRKRQSRLGPEAPVPDADADVDVDARASPVTGMERLLPEYLAEDLDGTLRPARMIQGPSLALFASLLIEFRPLCSAVLRVQVRRLLAGCPFTLITRFDVTAMQPRRHGRRRRTSLRKSE